MRWLMLELTGPWGFLALIDSPAILDPVLGRSIALRAQAADVRVAAIRRPGRRPAELRWRWALADARPGHEYLLWGEVDGPEQYAEIPLDGSAGTPSTEPLVAVCTHGKHDQCCAVRGRRAAAAIAERYPEATWECSHLGGDRFAATMLVLPHGLYYGRVDQAQDPADIVARYEQGRVDPRYLRGRSSYPGVVQVAQHHARMSMGDDRIDAYAPLAVVESDGEVEVTLDGPHGPVVVRLRETFSEPIFTMCQARAPGPVKQWDLLEITGRT
ncbi:sucrase ferredoxin [Dietzia sp. ANT_WB102]|uniref:sucrase ferredoxin n=1 Tax=Dietzia sp. ANT_WB102 TaxID=2597345 RepID=UPI0011ED1C6B|nr:sucrase ferredoxin [Dietzia sp. ANT_WB102]KAA0919849.1 sucrase ferredoxin [Dietzia sp. ANT_WB102]